MHKKNNFDNLEHIKKPDEIKFVISDRKDYDWAVSILKEYSLNDICDTVLFSPAFGVMDEKELAEWLIEDKHPVRMQLQTHKYIWAPDKRGV
jgi:7-carboxy-7-deazaguanine synthase